VFSCAQTCTDGSGVIDGVSVSFKCCQNDNCNYDSELLQRVIGESELVYTISSNNANKDSDGVNGGGGGGSGVNSDEVRVTNSGVRLNSISIIYSSFLSARFCSSLLFLLVHLFLLVLNL
jgi:hypothetical protein